MNDYPKLSVCMETWVLKALINGWKNKDIQGTWYTQIQKLWDKVNVGICSCSECNGDIIIEVAKVYNLVSMEGEIFEIMQKWAKVNSLCACQSPSAIEL